MLVALVLPPLLVHRMVSAEYSAWVLILQCSAYVSLLDLGLQAAIGKFVAEYDALGDRTASSRILSCAFAILCVCALVGAVGIAVVVWRVPQLFHQMPTTLVSSLREGIFAVGISTVIALPFSAFLAVFNGLQRYGFPTVIAMISKISTTAALAIILLMHGSLVQLAWGLAFFNVATALAQFFGWRKYARERVGFSWRLVGPEVALALVKYGSVLSIWTVAMLLISGLDIVIVGHYDYKDAGYYGIASAVSNFMVLVIGSLFGPLMPAVSALQSGRTSSHIGDLTIRATRYCALLVCFVGLPLVFGAYPLLHVWVGHDYAIHSVIFLQVLVLGNAIRQLAYPYALIVVATGQQHLATIAGVMEAVVNACLSIYLVQRIGAVGVAIGTLVGALVSLGLHLSLSMKYTRTKIAMSRSHFVLEGILRPLSCSIPFLLLLPMWKRLNMLPLSPTWIALWFSAMLGIGWFVGLTRVERGWGQKILAGWYTGTTRERNS
jgi:O-antigen/teichoic acid export membrane protein